MKILQLPSERIKFSPDEPAGGAPVSAPESAPAEPASAPDEGAVEASEAADFEKALTGSLDRRGVLTGFNNSLQPEEGGEEIKSEDRLIEEDIRKANAEPEPEKVPEVKPPVPPVPPVDQKQPEQQQAQKPQEQKPPEQSQKPPEPQAPRVFDINGKQVPESELVKMASHYDARADEVDRMYGEFEAVQKSPEMLLIKYMKEHPEARAKFQEFVGKESPEFGQQIQKTETDLRLEKIEAENRARWEQFEGQRKQEAEQKAQSEYQARAQQIQQKFVEIDSTAKAKAKELGLPENMVDLYGELAMSKIGAKDPDGVAKFMIENLEAEAKRISSIREQERAAIKKEYQSGVKKAPPVPPTSGSTPNIRPESPKGFGKELRSLAAEDLKQAFADLG